MAKSKAKKRKPGGLALRDRRIERSVKRAPKAADRKETVKAITTAAKKAVAAVAAVDLAEVEPKVIAAIFAASDVKPVAATVGGDVPAGLVETQVHGSSYKLLGMIDPKATPTDEQRHAIAQRLLEVGPKLPRYVPGAERQRIVDEAKKSLATPRASEAAPAARSGNETDGRETSTQPGGSMNTKVKATKVKATKVKATTVKTSKKPTKAPGREPHEFHSSNDPKNSAHAKKAAEAKAAEAKAAGAKPSELARQASAATTKVKGVSGSKKDEFAGFPLTSKLKKIDDKHDFRDGSIRATIFAKLLKCATVADALKVSSDPWHLRTAVTKKRIQVVK